MTAQTTVNTLGARDRPYAEQKAELARRRGGKFSLLEI